MDTPVHFEELADAGRYDAVALGLGAPLTQSAFYGEWQKKMGREVRRFVGLQEDKPVLAFQAVRYPLAFGKSYLYFPYGPVRRGVLTESVLAGLNRLLAGLMREARAAFARLDFTPPLSDGERALVGRFFRRAPRVTYHSSYFQPRAEWILDLKPPEEILLKGMHHNTRYGIRFAEKHGVRVNIVEPPCLASHFSDFYGALEETSARNKFNPHPRAYLEEVFRSANVGRNAFLVLGSYEGKILVAHLIVLCGNVAYFLFGGSSDAHRELQPSYAAQWAAIRRAKALGCVLYNFGGVSASFDKRDEWRGLSDFKRKFGGGIVAHSEFFDAVQNPFLYALYAGRKLFQRAMGR